MLISTCHIMKLSILENRGLHLIQYGPISEQGFLAAVLTAARSFLRDGLSFYGLARLVGFYRGFYLTYIKYTELTKESQY